MATGNAFGLTCPTGSAFYSSKTHNTSAFLGCCTIDPSTTDDWLCPQKSVRAMTFNADAYANIPTQLCLDNSSDWYTCAFTDPPFIGCCDTNPCSAKGKGGCPAASMRAARLSEISKNEKAFLDGALTAASSVTSTSTTTKRTTKTVTGTMTAQATTATASSTTTTPANSTSASAPAESGGSGGGSSGIQPGVAAGIAIGAAAAVAVIALLIFWLVRRRRHAAAAVAPFSPDSQHTVTSKTAKWRSSVWSRHSSAPSKCLQTPPTPGGPFPPAYQAVATQEVTGPVELPGNLFYELPAESQRPPPSHR